MTHNPYLLDLPAAVAFSGGRTSGFMLKHVLDAHGGQPDDLKICFQNTGLEHPATYQFVKDCAENWGVDITWLEYFVDEENKHACKQVCFDTASRKGEPFTQLIIKRQMLPNPRARFCTANLKMRTMDRHLKEIPAFKDGYINAVGLRYDEPRRALRLRPDNSREEMYCPMYHAKHTEDDVLAWWRGQPFDLGLPLSGNLSGNCVGCFLKRKSTLDLVRAEMPEHLDWWVEAEALLEDVATTGSKFRIDRPSYAEAAAAFAAQGLLDLPDDEDTIPCMCTD